MLVRLKDAKDLDGFAKAGRAAAKILSLLADKAVPGATTKELDCLARQACAERGMAPAFLGYHGFPGAVCLSVNEELVHGIPGDRVLRDGDLLKIDIGVESEGYIGDTAKTVRVGGARGDDLDRLIFDCHTALLRAVAKARPDADLADVGNAVAETAKEGGRQVVLNYGGHGIDRGALHTDPFVDNAGVCHLRLRPGMVFAIEPMFVSGPNNETRIADDGWTVLANGPTAHFEHTIVILTGGPEILTCDQET